MKRNTEHVTSEWLVINTQLGSAEAFEQLASLWYPKLLRYASVQLNDRDLAADAAQNTFLVISKKLHSLKDPAAFPAWAYQILHAQAVDLIRKNQRNGKLKSVLEEAQNLEPEKVNNERSLDFNNALLSLDAELYRTVHLHYLEGFSQAEVGQILSIPEGTVKSRVHTARAQLTHYLSGE